MKIEIDENILINNNLTLNEFLFLLFNMRRGDIKDCIDSLDNKKIANRDLFDSTKLVLSDNTKNLISNILIDSASIKDSPNRFIELADKLRDLYPKGRKSGTTFSWRGSTAEIARKLKNLSVKYNCKFTDDEAIKATTNYVKSFSGDYKYMKLLKYFLLKTPINNNGDIEVESEFMSYLENKDVGEMQNNNWVNELV